MSKELLLEVLPFAIENKSINELYATGRFTDSQKDVFQKNVNFGECKLITKFCSVSAKKFHYKKYIVLLKVEKYYERNIKLRTPEDKKRIEDFAYIPYWEFDIRLSKGILIITYSINKSNHLLEKTDNINFDKYMLSYLIELGYEAFRIWDETTGLQQYGDYNTAEYNTTRLKKLLDCCRENIRKQLEDL